MKSALQASLAGRSLSEILVERGAISELDLALTVAEHHRLDHVDLELFDVDDEATTLVDPAAARRLGALPIAFLPGGAVAAATCDPTASQAIRELSELVGRPVQPAVSARNQIEALIASLHAQHVAPPSIATGPVALAPVVSAAPQQRLRAVAAVDVPASQHPADALRPTAPMLVAMPAAAPAPAVAPAAPAPAPAPAAVVAAPPVPMQPSNENEQRVRAAEALGRAAEVRAEAADERATKAEKMLAAATSRATGLMAAASAADEALARLAGTCEVLKRDAQTREREMQALRRDLGSERSERIRLEEQREPRNDHELLALHVRVAELERALEQERASAAPATAAPRAVASFAPPPAAAAHAPAPTVEVKAAVAEAAPADEPAVAQVAESVAQAPERAELPSSRVTIDIVGEPGVAYVSALAPMPPIASPAKAKSAKSAAKARGLRRLIGR